MLCFGEAYQVPRIGRDKLEPGSMPSWESGRVCRFPARQDRTRVEQRRRAGAAGRRGRGTGWGLELCIIQPSLFAGERGGKWGQVWNGGAAVLEGRRHWRVDGGMWMDKHEQWVDWTRRSTGGLRVVERRREF